MLLQVHVNRSEPSLSLAFDYAEHDLYEIIWHHRDRLAGEAGCEVKSGNSKKNAAPVTY